MAEVTPTYQETATSNVPEWARQYAQDILGFGAALTYPKFNPATGRLETGFQPYQGELVAGLSPLQQQAMGDLSRMQVSPQTAQATGLTGLAALQAQNLAQYQPLAGGQFYQAPSMGQINLDFERVQAPTATDYQMGGPERVSAPGLVQYQMGPAERVGAERFGLGAMREYMSPYMEGVVERQKRGAVQDYLKQLPGIGAASVRAGARGGSREALLESEARRGLSERLGDIEAQGLQQAYQQAAGQFGQDRAALMQAALANQAAGLTTGQQNLAAQLGVQQLGAGQSLQAQLANQQAMQQASGQNLQAQIQQAQFAAQQAMQAGQTNQAAQLQQQAQALQQQQALNQAALQSAGLGAQYGLAGTQLGEQSRQFGAGLGLQGLQQQLAAAGQLGQLGQQQYGQQAGILQAQLGAGAQQQALKQQMLASDYQRFIDEMQYPYKQLEFMSNLIRGIPTSDSTRSVYTPFSETAALGGIFGSGGNPFATLFGGR